eukprot:3531027-Pyramimonas_sp.AAC.1
MRARYQAGPASCAPGVPDASGLSRAGAAPAWQSVRKPSASCRAGHPVGKNAKRVGGGCEGRA